MRVNFHHLFAEVFVFQLQLRSQAIDLFERARVRIGGRGVVGECTQDFERILREDLAKEQSERSEGFATED